MTEIDRAVDRAAQKIWSYMVLGQTLTPANIILALGCSDESVAHRAAELYLQGYGRQLLVAGGVGRKNNLLTTIWIEPTEAEHFAQISRDCGVPRDKILVESHSTNTGENISYSYQLLKRRRLETESIIVVTKPHIERRALATFRQQWPTPGPGSS